MKQSISLLIMIPVLTAADTLNVPSEYSTIFAAISAAQNGDTVLVAPGQYGGGFGFQGKNIVVRSSAGADYTYLESPFSDYHCVMFIHGEDSTAVLEGFSITNGDFDGESGFSKNPPDYGGGIYIYESSPTIRNCRIVNCGAGSGAGIYINYSSARIIDCTISNNVACINSMRGGGLFAGRSGPDGPPLILNCDILSNDAQHGGGIQAEDSFVRIINNSIHDNSSIHDGGGINIQGDGPELISNIIFGNDGGSGGGIRIYADEAILIGNMIVENTADLGGGVDCILGYLLMENNTICMNTAMSDPYGTGGVSIKYCDSADVSNNVIWGNQAPNGTVPNMLIYDTYLSMSYTNLGGGYDSIWVDSTSTIIWGPGNIDIDPMFETGPLCEYHLSLSSPCIDAGNPAIEYNDPEDPFNPGYALWPAMGYLRNDMGAFGGGSVGYWLSVEEEEQVSPSEGESGLICYPNPSPGSVSIMIPPAFIANTEILAYDISGKLVRRFTDIETDIIQWDCDDESGREVPSGVYLIQAISGDISQTIRVVRI